MAKPIQKVPPTQPGQAATPPQTGGYGAAGGYGKGKSIWKWVVIYLVLAVIVYAIIYIVVVAKRSGGYSKSQTQTQGGSLFGY